MNVVKLNTISLDGDTFIKKGGSSTTKTKYTGHADVEGLKAIGWDDEDIAYFQEHGVDWDEEEDEYYKVSEENKMAYGNINFNNMSSFRNTIVYLPKIPMPANYTGLFRYFRFLIGIPKLNTSNVTGMCAWFEGCQNLKCIPQLDTSNVTDMYEMFDSCSSLEYIPQLDTSNVTRMGEMFYNCTSLKSIPQLDTSNATDMRSMFYKCHNLKYIPQLNTSNVTNMGNMFGSCTSLESIPQLDTSNVTTIGSFVSYCHKLKYIPPLDLSKANSAVLFSDNYAIIKLYLKNISFSMNFNSFRLNKDSVLYIINNEAATSPITLTLLSAVYDTLINDEEIIAALEAHPNVSLAK